MTHQISICRSIAGRRWRLQDKLNFGLPIALLTWRCSPVETDGGPPLDVAQALAHSMVKRHRASFLVAAGSLSTTTRAAESSAVQSVESRGVVAAFSARWHGEPAHWHWLSTRDAAVAATLFYQLGFDWKLQAQVVLLSDADAAAPVLTLELTQSLWRGGSPEALHALVAAGVRVVIRAGVDGAVLGAVGLLAGAVQPWLDATQARCVDLGWLFQEVAESGL